jgi:hypothetical protein
MQPRTCYLCLLQQGTMEPTQPAAQLQGCCAHKSFSAPVVVPASVITCCFSSLCVLHAFVIRKVLESSTSDVSDSERVLCHCTSLLTAAPVREDQEAMTLVYVLQKFAGRRGLEEQELWWLEI